MADDVCFSPALVAAFLDEYTLRGELVLDPFAGFGSTLGVCNTMGRRAIGVELLPERAEFIRSRIGPPAQIHCADAREVEALASLFHAATGGRLLGLLRLV